MAGLPRSGSTLLVSILKQNPRFHASVQGPVAELFSSLVHAMSGVSDSSIFITNLQRERILKSMIEAYYAALSPDTVIFDNHRSWCLYVAALASLFPQSRIVCCVRNPSWILDSIERHVQRNALQPSKLFNFDSSVSVYSRAEQLMKNQLVGPSLNALRQAWFGEHANRLIAIRYDSLTEHPSEVVNRLYELLGEEPYDHNFNQLTYDEPEFDSRLGFPGFHTVSARVETKKRETILPLDLFRTYDDSFWELPGQNPRRVPIL
jgi:sulfotransferase